MAETFIFTPAGMEDLTLGYGPFSSVIPDGTTATLHAIGVQTFLGPAFLNANDQTGATSGDQIDAADEVLADGNGVVVLPPDMAAGESSTVPETTLLIDFRGTAEGIGLRFNLEAAVTGGMRSKVYLGDEYDAAADADFGYSLRIQSTVNDPETSDGDFSGVYAKATIGSQSGDFAGVVTGVSGQGSASATNGAARTAADVRGGGFKAMSGGDTNATRLWSLLAFAPENSGSGTVGDAVAFVAEAVDAVGSGLNLSILSAGRTELVGAVGIGIVPDDTIGLLVDDSFDLSLQVSGLAQFDAPVGIGTAPNAAVGLSVVDAGTTGIEQYGIQSAFLASVECTFLGVGVIGQCDTAAGSFTQVSNASLYAKNPTKGAGSTITTLTGVHIENMTVGGTNYGLYSAHTGESVFSGRVSGTTHRLTGATPTTGIAAAEIGLGRSTITTIGANGAATAPTANPLGYLKINIAGTMAQIPYYNVA